MPKSACLTPNPPGLGTYVDLSTRIFPGVFMTEAQADGILKELRTIRVCVFILTVIIVIASVKETFNL